LLKRYLSTTSFFSFFVSMTFNFWYLARGQRFWVSRQKKMKFIWNQSSISTQFHEKLYRAQIPKAQNTVKPLVFFALLWSVQLKVARKMLVKSTPIVNFTNKQFLRRYSFDKSQTVSREKLCKTLLYKKSALKMLVKLTPKINFSWTPSTVLAVYTCLHFFWDWYSLTFFKKYC